MAEWLFAMSTDESPANSDKIISMLRRKIKRRLDRRKIAELVYSLQAAIRKRNCELTRLRHDYGQLEMAYMRQHLRDVIEIERLKKELSILQR